MTTHVRKITAEQIYKQQNTILHKGFSGVGYPYGNNKEYWIDVIFNAFGIKISGLSELTLGQRSKLIMQLKKGGQKLYKPYLPMEMADWRKGDPAIERKQPVKRPMPVTEDRRALVNKINALLLDMGQSWTWADGISKRMFKIQTTEWLNPRQLHAVVIALVKEQNKRKTLYV